jgi:hypothetical protein
MNDGRTALDRFLATDPRDAGVAAVPAAGTETTDG